MREVDAIIDDGQQHTIAIHARAGQTWYVEKTRHVSGRT
jgi:hypothetical protein